MPLAPPRPTQGPRSVDAFVESLHGNDGTFDVIVNQARILTLKQDITTGPTQPLIAVGDPTILDFTVVNSRQLRIIGRGIGVTDLAITTARNETYNFEIRVLADLTMIKGKLQATFPDATIKLSQIRDHFVVEGEARDPAQIARIIQTIGAYLASVFVEQGRTVTVGQTRQVLGALGVRSRGGGALGGPRQDSSSVGRQGLRHARPGPAARRAGNAGRMIVPGGRGQAGAEAPVNPLAAYGAAAELGGPTQSSNRGAPPQIINLLRVVGSQQVMLKVRIAELNRTAMRRIGANFLGVDPRTGGIVGSAIAGSTAYQGTIGQTGEPDPRQSTLRGRDPGPGGANSTVFGIFQDSNFEFSLTALRQNGLLKILAEPNLVALNGQLASFLAGGEFPVPVPQVSASGVAPTITVRFREFGVRLGLRPLHPRRRRHPAHRRPRGQQHRLHDRRHAGRRRQPGPRPEHPQGADHRRAPRGADPGHRRPAATDARRRDRPHPRPGRPADHRAHLQQYVTASGSRRSSSCW